MKLSFRTRLDRAPRRHANPIQRTIDRRLGGTQAAPQCDRQGDGRDVLAGRRSAVPEVHRRSHAAEDGTARGFCGSGQDGANTRRVQPRASVHGDVRRARPGDSRWRVGAIAGLTACLVACGGADKPATPSVKAVVPAIILPAVPASDASAPVAASAPSMTPDQPASAPDSASAPMASTPVVKISVFGDDEVSSVAITPMGMPSVVTPNQESVLQSALQSQFSDSGISVINSATGGTASSLQNELSGLDGGGASEPQRMTSIGANIVIQAHMLNDALGGETVDQYAAYLEQWAEYARSAGMTPVFEEDSPVCDDDHPQLAAYVDTMNTVGRRLNVSVIHQYAYVQGIANWQSHMISCRYPDATLLAAKAQQEMVVIAPLVKAALGE